MDLDQPDTWPPTLDRIEQVFFVGDARPRFAETSGALAAAARRAGARRLVKLSAFGADFAPEFLIAGSHRALDQAIEASGIAWTHLRPNVWMQNLVKYDHEPIRREGRFQLIQGGRQGELHRPAERLTVLTRPGHEAKVYTLTGPQALTYADAARLLSQATGGRIIHVPLTEEEAPPARPCGRGPGIPGEGPRTMDAFGCSGRFARVTPDLERLAEPKPIIFERFARDHAKAYQP